MGVRRNRRDQHRSPLAPPLAAGVGSRQKQAGIALHKQLRPLTLLTFGFLPIDPTRALLTNIHDPVLMHDHLESVFAIPCAFTIELNVRHTVTAAMTDANVPEFDSFNQLLLSHVLWHDSVSQTNARVFPIRSKSLRVGCDDTKHFRKELCFVFHEIIDGIRLRR